MDPELDSFRQAARRHADWLADYLEEVRRLPVASSVSPGTITNALPSVGPETGQSFDQLLAAFENTILPGLTLWNHPRFFAYFSVSSSPASILAELLIAGVNVNAMLWKSSPAATELETVTLNWLRDWLGLSSSWFGITYDTASISSMQAIAAARQRLHPECRTEGMRPGMVVYVSEHTHNSVEKGAITLGFGQKFVRKIPVDAEFRMSVPHLRAAIEADLAAGLEPCCIVASVGSTSTAAVEPVPAIADIAEQHNIWLHVDAAYAGPTAILPEMRWILAGIERADSLVLNPHKWLYVSIDCSVLYTRHPDLLRQASALSAEYLKTGEDGQVINYMDYGVQLGRRFRGLKLWYVFQHYGLTGLSELLRESLRLARLFRSWVETSDDFELAAPVHFSLVCFRHKAGSTATRQLLAEINASGQVFASHTVLNGQYVIRFAIGNFMTNEDDIRDAWRLITQTGARLHQPSALLSS